MPDTSAIKLWRERYREYREAYNRFQGAAPGDDFVRSLDIWTNAWKALQEAEQAMKRETATASAS